MVEGQAEADEARRRGALFCLFRPVYAALCQTSDRDVSM